MTTSRLHGTCVAIDGQGVLLVGAPGSGKSALALQLMALGAVLVADDQVILTGTSPIVASCPATIRGRIEARFVGVLTAEALDAAPLKLVVDLDSIETDRVPPLRHFTVNGMHIPLLYNVKDLHFPAAIVQFMRGDRSNPHDI